MIGGMHLNWYHHFLVCDPIPSMTTYIGCYFTYARSTYIVYYK